MELKPRTLPLELSVLRSLNTRANLSTNERQRYVYLEKGYKGEVVFDQLTEKLQVEMYVLNDLCLEFNHSTFQIDTLIISQEKIYSFEVKNYEGDFYYQSDSFHTLSNNEIKNPVDQLKRSKSLLHQLLKSLGIHLPIEGYVIFINPEFTLYQAPSNLPIIFPTQLNRFINKLDQTPSKLNGQHKKLADQLISLHQSESLFTRLPPYEYDQLKKGIICPVCHSFMISFRKKKVVCNHCGFEEDVESAVLRNAEEIKILFPDKKITTNGVYEWCQVIEPKRKINSILKKNLKLIGFGQWSYYE